MRDSTYLSYLCLEMSYHLTMLSHCTAQCWLQTYACFHEVSLVNGEQMISLKMPDEILNKSRGIWSTAWHSTQCYLLCHCINNISRVNTCIERDRFSTKSCFRINRLRPGDALVNSVIIGLDDKVSSGPRQTIIWPHLVNLYSDHLESNLVKLNTTIL